MGVGDFLKQAGEDVAKGAKVAGSVALPVAERTAQVLSGEAPEIDAEKRQQQMKMEDAQIAAKEQELTTQLETGRKYGTLTPEQQQQYVDQISQLYSHPRHAPTLMEKLRKAVHPNGAVAMAPTALPNATPSGGTVAADERNKLTSLSDQDELGKQQAQKSIDWFKKTMLPLFPPDQQASKLNEYIDHINGIVTKEPVVKEPKLDKAGIFDPTDGKYYTSDMLESGNAPKELVDRWASQKKADQAAADAKHKQWEAEQKEINTRQEKTLANESARMLSMFQNAISMDNFKDALAQIKAHETTSNGAIDLQKKMQGLLPAALAGNQQAQVGILADHIAMTTHQPGASMRPTKALFDEAAGSQPTLEKYRKYFDENTPGGFKSGLVLSPQEVRQMVDMAQTQVDAERETLQQMKQDYQQQLNPSPTAPRTPKGLKSLTSPPGGVKQNSVKPQQGVIVVSPEDMK